MITTKTGETLFGTTASAVSSLSMDPPMMLICLNQTSETHNAVKAQGEFAINILAADQGPMAYTFAKKGGDKFEGVRTTNVQGIPTLDGALATLVCRTAEIAVGGTHSVFLAEVIDATATEAEPLTYYRGKFGRFNPDSETANYLAVRRWVLTNRNMKNTSIDIDQLLTLLNIERNELSRALVKLSADRLISIGPGEAVTILPITSELMTGCLDARAAIQCGVLYTSMDSLTDEAVLRIRGLFDMMTKAKNDEHGDMRTFFDLNGQLQDLITGLSGSYELTQAFNRMGLGAVWNETIPSDQWSEMFDDTHQRQLVEAMEQRDVQAACQAVQNHAEATKKLARISIESHGGEV